MRLPSWLNCRNKREMGQALSPIERLIYHNEPFGEEEEREFREQLSAALDDVANRTEVPSKRRTK